MSLLRQLAVDASVDRSATFADAARALASSGVSAVAVLDGDRVVGILTADDVLRGLFPGYLEELSHTAFLSEEALAARVERAEPVERLMSAAKTAEPDAGTAHVAELFLHSEHGAVVLVEEGRYLGVVDQTAFVAALVRKADG